MPGPETGAGPLGEAWRERALSEQLQALPAGSVAVSCPAALGAGGLGRHLLEIAEALRRGGASPSIVCEGDSSAPATGSPRERLLDLARPLVRRSPSWRTWRDSLDFDARATAALAAGRHDHVIAFNGRALWQLRAAAGRPGKGLGLVSANCHLRKVAAQHALAARRHPLEASWTKHLVTRNLAEYERASEIYVAGEYIRESFLQEGFAAERLVTFPLTPDPRFTPAVRSQAGAADSFDVIYVGSLTVAKGVPLLIEAVERLSHARELRLILVGGWGTRAMRRHIQGCCARDARITVAPGDPLPHIARAAMLVHPSYEDGFAYAPAEALACGLPVLVSEDTGMKELIEEGHTGMVLPTGDIEALTGAIEAAYRGELALTNGPPKHARGTA